MNGKTFVVTAVLGFALGACRHTRQIEEPVNAPDETPPTQRESPVTSTGIPLGRSPSELLVAGAEKRIQQRLIERGHLKGTPSGILDERTEAALRLFQKSEGLPETGMPDRETVSRLNLPADDLFKSEGR